MHDFCFGSAYISNRWMYRKIMKEGAKQMGLKNSLNSFERSKNLQNKQEDIKYLKHGIRIRIRRNVDIK